MYQRYSCLFLLLLLSLAPTGSPAEDDDQEPATAINAWLDTLAIDPGVARELQSYADEKGDWPAETPERLANQFRQKIREDVARAIPRILAGEVGEEVAVDFLTPADFARDGSETRDDRGREFEEGVIRTEQFHVYPGASASPTAALAQFTDVDFRKRTSSRIEDIHEQDQVSCLRTKGMWGLLDPTWTCNRIKLFDEDGIAAEHSQVVSNPGDDGFQTIYFKESIKVFVATPRGLVLYYINYTRSSKLGAFKKKFGRGRIEESQRDRARALSEYLDGMETEGR
jgi:hypothetical protein